MGRYRARDLLLLPSLLSLARLPLAAAFVWLIDEPVAALAVLVAAGLTDVLDGWYARRFGQVTDTGTVVDPISDKLFVLTVVLTLLATGKMTLLEVLLLGARDIGELPLVVWLSASRRARQNRKEQPSANVPGKIATTLQFVAVVTALIAPAQRGVAVVVAALAGAVAAVSYWLRALRDRRVADLRV